MTKRFHLVITETTANENYTAELAAYTEKLKYRQYEPMAQSGEPQTDRVIKVLDVTVTETEFAAIKKAALETMA